MAVALAVGIAAADWLRPHPALVLAALLLLMAAMRRWRGAAGLLLVVVLFGALRYAYVQTAGRGNLSVWEGQRVTLTGTVVGEPEVRIGGGLAYVVAAEQVDGHAAAGRLYVTQWGSTVPGYGERVELRGRLTRPAGARTPGGFDQAAYLARQSVYLTLQSGSVERLGPGRLDPVRRAAVAVRVRLEGVLRRSLPQREGALMAGLLFGSRSELPEDIKEAFRAAGVFHLLAVSGGNVAMLVIPLLGLLRRAGVSPRGASALAIPVVIFFVFLTGASPSVLRAGLMASLVLLGDVLERERDALNTLGVASLLLLVISPALLFDLGFQLSVVATLGILLFARRFERGLTPRLEPLFGGRLGGWLAAGLSVTFAAQVLVEPLSMHSFGRLSLIAPLANLMVLLFVEWLVPFGMVVVVVGAFFAPIAGLLRVAAGPALTLMIYAVKAMASLPFAYSEVGRLPLVRVIAWYAALAFLMVRHLRTAAGLRGLELREQIRSARRSQRLVMALGVAGVALTAFTWRYALAAPPDRLTITFLDVGQGDATLIRAPGGQSMLIDAGLAYPADPTRGRAGYDAGAQVVLPYLDRVGLHRLDYLVLTHPDSDHVGGAEAVLRGVPVGQLLLTDPDSAESGQVRAVRAAGELGIPLHQPAEGERILLGRDLAVEVLGPPGQRFTGTRSDDNANCVVMRLTYREVSVLLACDLEAVAEARLVASGRQLGSDLLKVSHHGSGQSSTEGFLRAVSPRYGVISAGNGNPFGHPHAGTLERLRQAGAEVWRTDRHGTITLQSDGFSLELKGSRGDPAVDSYQPLALLGRRLFRAW